MLLSKEEEKKYKEVLLDTMRHFIDVCEKNGLQYYGYAGTCLGAIRHKGIIPWDDDIDVLMPRKDYERLLALRDELFSTGFEIIDTRSNYYDQPFAKFSNANTTIIESKSCPCVMGVYIDVFPLDEVCDINQSRELFFEKTHCFAKYRDTFDDFAKHDFMALLKQYHIKGIIMKLFRYLFGKLLSPVYYKQYLKVEKEIQQIRGGYWMYYGGFYGFDKELYPKCWFGSGHKVQFEDFEIIIPNDYEAFLKQMYGDYMTPPPPHKRYSHHNRYFVDLEKRRSLEDVLKLNIKDQEQKEYTYE